MRFVTAPQFPGAQLLDNGRPVLVGPSPELDAFAAALNAGPVGDVEGALRELIADTRDCSFGFIGEPFKPDLSPILPPPQMDLFGGLVA